MRKDHFIESVYLRVNGGSPTNESSVMRVDIEAYVPAAVNYALAGHYRVSMAEEGDTELPSIFYSEFSKIPIKKDDRMRGYIDMPTKIIPLDSNRGLRYVEADNNVRYKPLPEGASLSGYWDNVLRGVPYYQIRGKRILLFNEQGFDDFLHVGAITAVEALKDDDELPIPAGYEAQSIDVCVAFFKDQRFTPKDYIINGKDIQV